MKVRQLVATGGGTIALLGMVLLGTPVTWAQEATPEAVAGTPPSPVHIHAGQCPGIGEVVAPLTDLTGGTGEGLGQARRAFPAESSYTNVPLTLDAILGADHAINVHLSAEEIDTYIACGDLGGSLTPAGALIVGLGEENDSGYTGIAFLQPGADGASTDVSVFIAPTQAERRGGGAEEEEAAATLPETDEAAAAEGEGELVAGEQVPVSLAEFAITMPDSLPAGEVTFAVTNDGTITHSFEIESEEVGLEEELEAQLAPGETGMLTVDLAPGTYEVYCPVGNHRDQGMLVEVTVA